MYEVKTYYCDGIPTDKDLERAVDATWIYNCMVELRWFYYGEYSILIKPGEKWEDVKENKMPKTYPV